MRAYKQLKMAARAFRAFKDALDVRPIRHHLEQRVLAHFFLRMLAYYVTLELQARLARMLFVDEQPLAPADPVAKAKRTPAAIRKAGSAQSEDGLPAYSLADLLSELATLCRNQLAIGKTKHTIRRLTTTTLVQAKAVQLLNNKLGT